MFLGGETTPQLLVGVMYSIKAYMKFTTTAITLTKIQIASHQLLLCSRFSKSSRREIAERSNGIVDTRRDDPGKKDISLVVRQMVSALDRRAHVVKHIPLKKLVLRSSSAGIKSLSFSKLCCLFGHADIASA